MKPSMIILRGKLLITTLLFSISFITPGFAQQAHPQTVKPLQRARIVPSFTILTAGAEKQFYMVMEVTRLTAAYNPENTIWSVNGIPGGNARVGTISSAGLYKAPASYAGSAEIYITGQVKSADNPVNTATVLIGGKRPEYRTVRSFEEPLEQSLHFKKPTDIAVEKNGNFVISDKKVLRFSAEGKFINEFGEHEGDIIGHLDGALNIAVDRNDKIFVADGKITPPRIMAFNPAGKHLYSFGRKGYAPGMSFVTRGIAFDSQNRLYLGDVELNRITVFDNSGGYLFHFGDPGAGTGQLNGYYDLALDANNDVFVASYFGPCQKFDAGGRYLFSFGFPNPPNGIIYTTAIAADSNGDVYAAVKGNENADGSFNLLKDENNRPFHIIKYNNNGDRIANLRLSADDRWPLRLTIDRQNRLVVLYKSNTAYGVEVLEPGR